jgi:rhamnosyl/mannosyltransferase
MNILHVVKLYHPWIGGVEKVAQEMTEGIRNNANVHVLCCQHHGRGSNEFIGGVEVIKAGSFGTFFSMPLSFPFWYLFRKEALWADIVHIHYPFPLADMAGLFFIPKNKKVVITWHSDIWRQKRFLWLYKPLRRMFLKRVDIILVTSQNLLDHSECLQEFRKKCSVMPLFIDMKYWKNIKEREPSVLRETIVKMNFRFYANDIMEKKNNTDDNSIKRKIILFVGRLVYYKGVEYLIDAMRGIDAMLVIIGSGPLENRIKQSIQKRGFLQNIMCIPYLTNQELKWCYRRANIFVLPSIEKTEAFGLVQLEAMLFGLPIINTKLPTGVPWVSIHGETGLTVQPKDSKALHNAIQRIVLDDDLAGQMGERGRARAEEIFGKEKAISSLLETYRELLV